MDYDLLDAAEQTCVADDVPVWYRGVSRIFERGGPISLGSLKKRSSDFKRGGPMV